MVIEVFLKAPVIFIMRFGENNVLGTIYIDIYQFGGVSLGRWVTWFTLLFFSLFIETKKVYEHDLY